VDINDRLQNILQKCPKKDSNIICCAANLANLAGSEQLNIYGESCFNQGLSIAEILNTLQVDDFTIAAAIIYSIAQYADLSLEDIEEQLGDKVSRLVQLTAQMGGISELYEAVANHKQHFSQIDNIRKMLLAIVDDVRAVLIKLSEQLYILRNIKTFDDKQKRRIAHETMAIYVPLANRLGVVKIKWELEDLAFRYLQPQKYKQISEELNQRRVERERDVQKIINKLSTILQSTGIKNTQISGRAKHIYSIYRKMQRKNVGLNKIYDTIALRVVVPTIEDCYTALSNIHATWQHIPKEFDDYIVNPKENGYMSIHTAVTDANNKHIEIQIRTYKMHEEAELGMSAHWKYKEGLGAQQRSAYETKIKRLRQIMDWQKEVTDSKGELNKIHNIFDDRIYVFTPDNEIIDLPKGATVLDFAYHIHSEIGHRCKGAKVNNKIVNLTYQPKTGDLIEILTSNQPHPSHDWLNPHLKFLKTPKARAKIHHWFKKQDREKHINLGQEILEKEFRRHSLVNINISSLANKFNFKNSDDLFAALGCGDIKIGSIVNTMQPDSKISTEQTEILTTVQTSSLSNQSSEIQIQGIDNLLTHIANCCQPIPGDQIIGYITQNRGLSIHRQDCFNILRAKEIKPERLINVNWGANTTNRYMRNLVIKAFDRHGLVKDISNIIANENTPIVRLNAKTSKKDSIAHIELTIEIANLAILDHIVTKIKQLSDVLEIKKQL
jgi:GTP pyrophosphokinase